MTNSQDIDDKQRGRDLSRRQFLTRSAAVGLALMAEHSVASAAADNAAQMVQGATPKRPNLVYVFADQLRHQSCGYAGDRSAMTPNIDAFSKDAVSFKNAVASAPVCTAYRAALMTGKYTTSNGMVINELRMNPNQRCFGHILHDGGYSTSYIGKWHLYANQLGNHEDVKNSFVPPGPNRLGFVDEWKAYNFHHNYYNSYYHENTPEKIFYGPGVYEPNAQTDFAVDFIQRESNKDQPFALFLSWGPPHDPWDTGNVPKEFLDKFQDKPFPNPPNYSPENDLPYADDWATLSVDDRKQLEEWRRVYYAQTASLDTDFAKILKAIDDSGASDNTIVVFTSDHGEMFGAHGRRAKNIFYEEACRIPFLVRWPGHSKPGTETDVCLSTVDIMPTLVTMLGLEPPHDVEGMNLSHVVAGKKGPEPEAALMQICGATADWIDGHEWRAVRDKHYTYAIYRVDGKELLFNNDADPHQMTNLIDNPSFAKEADHLRKVLAEKMASINDTFESCTWYRDHWTDGKRDITKSATNDFTTAT